MVHGIEVGGDQVDRKRHTQAAEFLQQYTDIRASAIAFGHYQHLRRAIHTKDQHTPALFQVAGKETRAAADVGGPTKLYAVSSDKRFESRAGSNEVGNSKSAIIQGRKPAVRPGETLCGGNSIAHNR